jgi:hypothetical protein
VAPGPEISNVLRWQDTLSDFALYQFWKQVHSITPGYEFLCRFANS